MTSSQKREIERYLNELNSEVEAGENWEERQFSMQAIYGAKDILGILGYWVEEKDGKYTIGKN